MSVAEASGMTSQITTLTSNALATVTGGADTGAEGHFPGCGDLDFACQAKKVAQWRDQQWRDIAAQNPARVPTRIPTTR
jgi:hypothetical protein